MNIDTSSCTARPSTAAGAAYLRVALDPCGENLPVDFRGIPDGSEIDIVMLRMRDDLVLTPPSGDGTWGIIIFDTPYFIYQQIMVRYLDSAGPPSQTVLRESLNGMSRADVALAEYPQWFTPLRLAQESLIVPSVPRINFITPSPALAFQVSFLKPAVLSSFDSSPTSPGWSYIRKFRAVGKGRTLHLNAPATATQGRVVSGQIGTESSPKILVSDPISNATPIIQIPYPARFTVSPPFAFNTLAQQDLNARQDIIKTGSYDMQRHWNGAHIWNEVEDVRPIFRANIGNLQAAWSMPQSVIVNASPQPIEGFMKYDGFDVSLGWTVTHIDGMSQEASVHMKHRSYWEVNVPGSSPWAANKMAPCPHDAGALALEKQLAPAIAHSYEARFNDSGILGALLRTVTSVGKGVLAGTLSQYASRLAGGRRNVIEDPYAGKSLYGESRFTAGNGNKRNGKKR